MKKVLLGSMILLAAVSFASAGVAINWTVSWGAYDHNAADLTGGSNALLDSYSAIWQLIYAGANNVADPASWAQVGGANGDYVTGDDVVWGQRNIPQGGGTAAQDGTIWNNWMGRIDGDPNYVDWTWTTAGYVYQRVFEGTPGPETWYFESELVTLDTTKGEGGQPQTFYLDTGDSGFQPTHQFPAVIPEPATMSLLGLGALALAIRRRRA
ncbi:MAG TPA: PEP-CTERM sorting domain-containing protein [Kiritimatiellia bacterium]|nr:PEP-CTERM sorting domain-containing protein [Kiritimatiellia bacterium]